MNAMLSPENGPSRLLAPGLLAAVLCSTLLGLLQAGYGRVPEGPELSGTLLLVAGGLVGAFGGFFGALFNSTLVWLYGKIVGASDAGFVRTLAMVTFALGVTLALNLLVSGAELLLSGAMPAYPVTNLSRYFGPDLAGADALLLVNATVLYVGSRRYLKYGPVAAGVLVALFVISGVGVRTLV